MLSTGHGAIVVGFDGSPQSKDATLWAAREAVSRKRPLVVVYAFHRWLIESMGFGYTAGEIADQSFREWIDSALADVSNECQKAAPGLEIHTRVVSDAPIPGLRTASDKADLLVLGASGFGAVSRVVLGSTAGALARTCEPPLVVVRGKSAERPSTGGFVVVGVDGSEVSESAIGFALDFASRHSARLLAVHVWRDLPLPIAYSLPWDADTERLRTDANTILAESLAGWQERYPDVGIRRMVDFGQPAEILLRESADAQLLVVGSHGRGAIGRTVLGSVSHPVLYHAHCPVAIVHG